MLVGPRGGRKAYVARGLPIMSTAHPMTPQRRITLSLVVMTATLMQVLDTTIANVALPHMQAALGATLESIAWVLTSYILASAVTIPLTGWLESVMGRRALFTLCLGGFTAASALCGAAPTLMAMVAARAVQGVFGALLLPLSQAVMLDIYQPEKRAQAITIYSMGTMIGPISGPFIGGWLTDNFNWRWVFYVNVPFGIVATTLLWLLLDSGRTATRRFDMFGYALLATALASFQLLLDRGTIRDWFDSIEIVIEAGIAAAAFWMFVIHTLTARDPLIPRALFRDRNFTSASLLTVIIVGILYTSLALLAPMLQQLLNYDTEQTGALMIPRGVCTMAAMLIGGRLSAKIDPRIVMTLGMVVVVIAQIIMSGFDLMMDSTPILIAVGLQGLGLGLVVIPLTMLAYSTLPDTIRTDATAIFALVRSFSASVTIAIGGALVARNLQISHADLGAHVTAQTLPVLDQRIIEQLGRAGGTIAALVDAEINRQALMIAYLNDFRVMMWAALLVIPLLIAFRPTRVTGGATTVVE
jgi:DHA2 family multidrug resistance protein